MTYSNKTSKILKNHSILNINDLTINFDKIDVLNNINLSLNYGDFLYIVGPNGGGKSTLVKAILNLIKPSAGIVSLSTSNVGYLPQLVESKANFPITVKEVIYTGFKKQRLFIKKDEVSLINTWLDKLEMLEYNNHLFSNLSGGQKQRVLLIRALISNPDILILDEPTSALDPKFREYFYEVINELNKQGTTIIFITHDINNTFNENHLILEIDQEVKYFGNASNYQGGHKHV